MQANLTAFAVDEVFFKIALLLFSFVRVQETEQNHSFDGSGFSA